LGDSPKLESRSIALLDLQAWRAVQPLVGSVTGLAQQPLPQHTLSLPVNAQWYTEKTRRSAAACWPGVIQLGDIVTSENELLPTVKQSHVGKQVSTGPVSALEWHLSLQPSLP